VTSPTPQPSPSALFTRIDHIGIAVPNLDEAIAYYEASFGLTVTARETNEAQGVHEAMLGVQQHGAPVFGGSYVQLLEPTRDDSPVGKFLAKKGPGIHHVAYQVTDIEATLASLKDAGVKLIDETPRTGIRNSRVAFLHPSGSGGVLTEIVQPAEDH
jgi:methylmalonyl-CoA/ethylmalonyl-CoA epimerase